MSEKEAESIELETDVSLPTLPGNGTGARANDSKGGTEAYQRERARTDEDPVRELSVEAYITPDDVIRAGGFGARDDMSSLLPVATDSTDFEATILDARSYEEPQGDISRPGLGWRDPTEKK